MFQLRWGNLMKFIDEDFLFFCGSFKNISDSVLLPIDGIYQLQYFDIKSEIDI